MILWLTLACVWTDTPIDEDGDGVALEEDCDDRDPGVKPGADELCNGVDDDCDGDVDEAAVDRHTYFRDADADGFGDPAVPVPLCELTEGYVDDDTDCDDACPGCGPGLVEVCDGRDNDCDGDVDEEDAEGALAFYLDEDGDGYGDPEALHWLCAELTGTVEEDTDCDDADPDVHPGAIDHCGDLVDGDCDGELVDCVVEAEEVDGRVTGLRSGDGLGASVLGPGDVDADGLADIALGAPWNSDAALRAGAIYLFSGPVTGDSSVETASSVILGQDIGDQAGSSLAFVGDVDLDGRSDLFIGASHAEHVVPGGGAAYLLMAPFSSLMSLDSANAILVGETQGAHAGMALAGGADLDGDGIVDFVVAAPEDSTREDTSGAVHILLGPLDGTSSLADAEAVWFGEEAHDVAGTSVCMVGDVDGDGLVEVGIGAPEAWGAAQGAGVAYLVGYEGPNRASLAAAPSRLEGVAEDDRAGQSIAPAGDLDGDGLADVAVGAWLVDEEEHREAGAVYLILGPAEGTQIIDRAGATLLGGRPHAAAGVSLANVGDVDGSGLSDLLVGAWFDPELSLGAGMASLALDPTLEDTLLGDSGPSILAAEGFDRGGAAVAGLGDTNGDGLPDVVIGVPGSEYGDSEGEAFIVLGREIW